MTDKQLVEAAREWIGTPFVHTGREKGLGCDCVGLFLGIARERGITTWDDRAYSRLVDPARLEAGLLQFCRRVRPGRWRAGDILLIAIRGTPQHVALLTEKGTILHAYEGVGVAEHTFAGSWERNALAAYRWRGLRRSRAKAWRRSS